MWLAWEWHTCSGSTTCLPHNFLPHAAKEVKFGSYIYIWQEDHSQQKQKQKNQTKKQPFPGSLKLIYVSYDESMKIAHGHSLE